MPELPEVETVCRGLRPHLIGHVIQSLDVRTPRLRWPLDREELRRTCVRAKVLDIRRRGKYLIVELSDLRALIIHLGMTGAFRTCGPAEPVAAHEHMIWTLSSGTTWRFSDTRRFGSVTACKLPGPGETPTELDHLGPEPLAPEFDAGFLYRITRKRKRPIKNLIMDQQVVVGVGNIYANEALFRAWLRPRRAAHRLTKRHCERLVQGIKGVLAEAIDIGGTTISSFKAVDGSEGKFRTQLDVYGREGLPCTRCGSCSLVKRIVLGGRATYYCPKCQH